MRQLAGPLQCPVMNPIHQQQLTNGLWLIAEPIPSAQSLAMSMLIPAGMGHEPFEQQGVAGLLAEMICRGAGGRDAKAHSDALDQLGVQRGTSVESAHLNLGATMIGTQLPKALPLLLDMVLAPALEESALVPSRDLALQALDALEDEPQQKVFDELRRLHLPEPFGRSSLGIRQNIESIHIDQVRQFWRSKSVPDGSVLGFAGRFDWPHLRDQVEKWVGDWQGQQPDPESQKSAVRGYQHVNAQSAQVHIGLAYDAVAEPNPNSILQRVAMSVLSGGMSGRLFTEVREKRGLCYSVFAGYGGQKRYGAVLSYAGTTVPRAQQTLDVLTAELIRLSKGVKADEFDRAVVGMKSRLVMQGESTGARASAIVSDQYLYGRPRSLEERASLVAAVTLPQLNEFVKENPPGPMTVVTIGPDKLKVS